MGNATQHLGSDHMEFSVCGKSDLEAQLGEAGTHPCPTGHSVGYRSQALGKGGRG